MNLVDAVKKGTKIRRQSWQSAGWIKTIDKSELFYWEGSLEHAYVLSADAALADDWEADERKVEVTASQLRAIMEKNQFESTPQNVFESTISYTALVKELGLLD